MSKWSDLWQDGKEPTLPPSEAEPHESPYPEPITFQTQIQPALGQLSTYLQKKYHQDFENILKLADKLKTVDSQLQAKSAVTIIATAKKLVKELEGERKQITNPLLHFKTGVDNSFKEYTLALTGIEATIKRMLATYEARVEMERRQAEKAAKDEAARIQAALDKEAQEKGVEAPQVVVPVVAPQSTTTRTEDGTASVVKKWKCRVIDPDLVPRDYCEPSQMKLDAAAKAGVRRIEGCEIYEDSEIRVRL